MPTAIYIVGKNNQRDESKSLNKIVFIFYCGVTHDYKLSGLKIIYNLIVP